MWGGVSFCAHMATLSWTQRTVNNYNYTLGLCVCGVGGGVDHPHSPLQGPNCPHALQCETQMLNGTELLATGKPGSHLIL